MFASLAHRRALVQSRIAANTRTRMDVDPVERSSTGRHICFIHVHEHTDTQHFIDLSSQSKISKLEPKMVHDDSLQSFFDGEHYICLARVNYTWTATRLLQCSRTDRSNSLRSAVSLIAPLLWSLSSSSHSFFHFSMCQLCFLPYDRLLWRHAHTVG